MKNGTLILNVEHGKEIEVEYEKNEIKEKINSFFGYNCISNVRLKIVQEKLDKEKKFSPKIKNLKEIEEKMKNVKNEKLRSSLEAFLKTYNEKIK